MLKLGDFIFDIDDYPQELQIGGSSLVSVEKYPGGNKSVQNFGAYDDPITLKGTFVYQGAHAKAGTLYTMWKSGQTYLLIPETLNPRWVEITVCKLNYKNEYYIDYELTLEPINSNDPNSILYSATPLVDATPSTAVVQSASPQRTYVVAVGDTLWKIASKPDIYGDGSQYDKIMNANNIKDPSGLTSGQVLVIP